MKRLVGVWRVLVVSNLGLAAYMFSKPKKKNMKLHDSRTARKDIEDSNVNSKTLSSPEAALSPSSPSPSQSVSASVSKGG
ncbi:unnamed protein product [Cuscuta campestris]|uniref:Uncharacterized protein n=1 Tax=Cuscuta campestris TaxID=132261 RepID=A0A484K107_9ASTE|nr:unnamed protein product [Cuscuta campestris]